MTSPTPAASAAETPVQIELEFVRTEQADDPFAFRFARQTYLVRGRQGDYETVELPWSRELLADLQQIRTPGRDPAVVARVGGLLRDLLDPAGWVAHEATIAEARAQRRRVHLTIRSAAAELYALPWELLSLRSDGQHLGALEHVLLRYAWPGTSTATVAPGPASDPGRGRILLAWSAVGGAVPAADQIKAIEQAAEDHAREGAVEVLSNASYGSIDDALQSAEAAGRPFRILHLLCHGAEAGSTFGLALDAEDGGRSAVVDAGRLQQLLAPHADVLRLVVVSACDGGNMGQPGNRIGSVAQRLHRSGLRYVIASRYPLSARGSTRITGALYRALLGDRSVEHAFIEARAAAAREVAQLDWANLQLYARPEDGDDGRILAAAEQPDRREPKPEPEPKPESHSAAANKAAAAAAEPTTPKPTPDKPAKAERPEPAPRKEPARTPPPAAIPRPTPAQSPPRRSWFWRTLAIISITVIAMFVGLMLIPDEMLEVEDEGTDGQASSSAPPSEREESTPATEPNPDCVTTQIDVEIGTQPVDLAIVIDESVDLDDGAGPLAKSLGTLVQSLEEADLDPHVILFAESTEDGSGICVPAPLGSGQCPRDHNPPRYWRVGQPIGRHEALEHVVHDYDQYSDALRYGAEFHLVVLSNDNAEWTAEYFTDQLITLDPYFELFVLHGIIGSAGTTYRALAMQTHGWLGDIEGDLQRQTDAFTDRLVNTASWACEQEIPLDDEDFDAERLNLSLRLGPSRTLPLGKVKQSDDCDDVGDGWYYDHPEQPNTLLLCPDTCDKIHDDTAVLEVRSGCETIVADKAG